MNSVSQSPPYLYLLLVLISSAFAIVKDMNFHPRFDKPTTPQKNKSSSDTSPTVKRFRLTSPPPSPISKRSLIKSEEQGISLLDDKSKSISKVKENEVSFLYIKHYTNALIKKDVDNSSSDTVIEVKRPSRHATRSS
jgi:hypothetical protein